MSAAGGNYNYNYIFKYIIIGELIKSNPSARYATACLSGDGLGTPTRHTTTASLHAASVQDHPGAGHPDMPVAKL